MMIRRAIHRAIVWYLRRCAGAFHTFPYGDHGRYVVLMNEREYHYYKEDHDAALGQQEADNTNRGAMDRDEYAGPIGMDALDMPEDW